MFYIIGVFIFTSLLIMKMGSFAPVFIHVPSALIIIPAFLFALAATSGRSFHLSWMLAFGMRSSSDASNLRQACEYVAVLGNCALWLGGVGVLIGGVLIAIHIQEPTQIGPALAIGVLSLLYALILKVLCITAEARLRHRMGSIVRQGPVEQPGGGFYSE